MCLGVVESLPLYEIESNGFPNEFLMNSEKEKKNFEKSAIKFEYLLVSNEDEK